MYEPLNLRDLHLGDVVRKVGRPLVIGYIVGFDQEMIQVRWSLTGPIKQHHFSALQRRLDGTEIRV